MWVHLSLELLPWSRSRSCSGDSAIGCGATGCSRARCREAKGRDPCSHTGGSRCVVFHEQLNDSSYWNHFIKFLTANLELICMLTLTQKLNSKNPGRKSNLYFLSPLSPFTQSLLSARKKHGFCCRQHFVRTQLLLQIICWWYANFGMSVACKVSSLTHYVQN